MNGEIVAQSARPSMFVPITAPPGCVVGGGVTGGFTGGGLLGGCVGGFGSVVGGGATVPFAGVISIALILFDVAPAALLTVNRPSLTVTVAVPSTHRLADVVVAFTTSRFSTAILIVSFQLLASPLRM